MSMDLGTDTIQPSRWRQLGLVFSLAMLALIFVDSKMYWMTSSMEKPPSPSLLWVEIAFSSVLLLFFTIAVWRTATSPFITIAPLVLLIFLPSLLIFLALITSSGWGLFQEKALGFSPFIRLAGGIWMMNRMMQAFPDGCYTVLLYSKETYETLLPTLLAVMRDQGFIFRWGGVFNLGKKEPGRYDSESEFLDEIESETVSSDNISTLSQQPDTVISFAPREGNNRPKKVEVSLKTITYQEEPVQAVAIRFRDGCYERSFITGTIRALAERLHPVVGWGDARGPIGFDIGRLDNIVESREVILVGANANEPISMTMFQSTYQTETLKNGTKFFSKVG